MADDLPDLIARIYDAALDQGLWDSVLNDLARMFADGHASLYLLHESDDADSTVFEALAATSRWDPAFLDSYAQHFWRVNPWSERVLGRAVGEVTVSDTLVPRRSLERTEFYSDWLRPQQLFSGIGGTFLRRGGVSAHVSVLHAEPMAEEETARLTEMMRRLLPHFARAAQIHQRLGDVATQRDALETGLDRLSIGVILTDPTGRVSFSNRVAEALLRAGTALRIDQRGLLCATQPGETAKLRQLIASASMILDDPGLAPGGGLTLSDTTGGDQLAVLVSPVSRNRPLLSLAQPKAAVFIAAPTPANQLSQPELRRLYGLTATEARIAGELAAGLSLKEIATRLDVSYETIRNHLKKIFIKTRTNRQSELVRLLLRNLPAIGSRTAAE
ncbi:helix-turn-helix transcriptional regulator [Inquilinus limosus]|uniref:helix-turn-helix transcriptional regulator n=1 Tax=Inquilinus limosus TaxID=171674 RepID=UPI003F1691A9